MQIRKHFSLLVIVTLLVGVPSVFLTLQSVGPTVVQTSDTTLTIQFDWTGYYCDDFEEAKNRIWKLVESISFYFGQSMHYGLYLAAKFVERDSVNATLLVYAFVQTETQYYVTSQAITLDFTLNGSYHGEDFDTADIIVDSTPVMTTSNCMCQYPLYHQNFTKSKDKYTLSLVFDYQISCDEFDESGVLSTSASLATSPSIPIPFYQLLFALALAVLLWFAITRHKKKPNGFTTPL
jgi:uncharacterized membrane protein